MKKFILIVVMFLLTTPVWAIETDNDNVVITVKESPAFVNKAGKVVKQSENLEKVCLSMKLAMLLRTDLITNKPMGMESLPQVTYFPMLDGVRIIHTDVLANQDLTCNVEGTVYTLDEMLSMLHDVFSVDVQVCWDCWISRYGVPLPTDSSSNPVYGGYTGVNTYPDLMIFLNQEKMAIQSMFNHADKIIDYD